MKNEYKITGFQVPPKYFKELEDRLFVRIEEDKLPKSTGFTVPEQYFAQWKPRIDLKELQPKSKGKVISILPKKYLGYAAVIAASLVIGIIVLNFDKGNASLNNIQLGLIDRYIEEGNLNMDLYDLTSYLESRDISIVDFKNQNVSENTLKTYLLENWDDEIFENK